MGYGDEIVAAGQAQAYFERFGTRVAILDVNRRRRWHPMWDGNPVIVRPDETVRDDEVSQIVSGPNCRPYIVYPFTKDTGWTFQRDFRCRDHIAKLYLTESELARGESAIRKYGSYVLIEPFTKHVNFRWPMDRWAELVAACPDVTFVQHTHPESERVPGARYEQATFREACGLIASARAYVRSESGLCHAAAALGRPQVTLFGACMDADVMGGYPRQVCIVDSGPSCGSWHPCQHCAEAMRRITVAQVRTALMRVLEETDVVDHAGGSEAAPADHGRRGQRRHRSEARTGQRDRDHAPQVAG